MDGTMFSSPLKKAQKQTLYFQFSMRWSGLFKNTEHLQCDHQGYVTWKILMYHGKNKSESVHVP